MSAPGAIRIAPPQFGEPTDAASPSEEARRLLALRRSTSVDLMIEPGPDRETLDAMLEIAARAPDHRRVFPFRFIVMRGAARERAGEILARRFAEMNPEAAEARVDAERQRFMRAPVIVTVVARLDPDHKTPEWEQMVTVGAVCQNLLLAASAYGFAANLLTEWCAYDVEVLRGFGIRPGEKVAGFVYLGAARESPRERMRPVMAEIVSEF